MHAFGVPEPRPKPKPMPAPKPKAAGIRDGVSKEEGFHVATSGALDHSSHIVMCTAAQFPEIVSFGIRLTMCLTGGRENGMHPRAQHSGKLLFRVSGLVMAYGPVVGELWGEGGGGGALGECLSDVVCHCNWSHPSRSDCARRPHLLKCAPYHTRRVCVCVLQDRGKF